MPRLTLQTDWEHQRLHGNPSSPLRQIHFRRPRTRILRIIFLTTAIALCFIFFLSRGSGGVSLRSPQPRSELIFAIAKGHHADSALRMVRYPIIGLNISLFLCHNRQMT